MLENGTVRVIGEKLLSRLVPPLETAPDATLLLRIMAGSVFLWEGVLKFVYANQGVGRFTKLGIPLPAVTANFVGALEIVGGAMILVGLATRLMAIPLMIEMIVAMLSTKISLFLGTSPLPLPPAPPTVGMWAVLHEVRSEWAQLLVCAFLLRAGPGRLSLDALLSRGRGRRSLAAHHHYPNPPESLEEDRHCAGAHQ
jgi:putative oxidoreductase